MAAIVTASESNVVSQLNQVMDQITVPGRKWFSLQDNTLDGTFHPIDSSGAEQVGWWGIALSGVGGVFASAPVLTITETRSIQSLQVAGDSLLNEFPVDFTIKLYNGAALLYTETVVGNALVTWKKNLTTVYDVTKIEVTVTKINKASRVVKLTDTFSPFEILRSDAVKPKTTDTSFLSKAFYSTDNIKVLNTESKTLNVQVSRTDDIKNVLAENDLFTVYEIWRNDVITPTLTETKDVTASLNKVDVVNPKIGETQTVNASFNKTDIILVKTTDASIPVTATLNKIDSLLPKTNDVSTPVSASLVRTDSLLPKTADTSTPVSASFNRTDIVNPKVNESQAITASFSKADTVLVSGNLEDDLITASFDSDSALDVVLVEDTVMTNVHTKMNEAFRQTFAKVEVTYTDPFLDDTIEMSASSTAYGTDVRQLADNVEKAAYKWFSLTDNKLDGSYSPIDGTGQLSVGWWSADIADAAGDFVTPQTVEVIFEPRSLYYLKVSGDDKLNNYPVDFTVTCYDETNTIIQSYPVVGNTEVTWYLAITPLLNVARIVLEVYKINKAFDSVKLTEFFTSVVETYYDADLVNIDLLEELAYPSNSITLGAISSNEIDVTFDNSSGKFRLGNEQSPLFNLVKRNRRLKSWLGTEIVPGTIEWYPLGVFWTLGWDILEDTLEAKTTARDRLELLRFSDFNISQVYENYTLYQLFEIVLIDAGLKPADYNISPDLICLVIPYAWFDRMTHREALQRLSSCAFIQVYCDRLGVIQIGSVDTSGQPIVTFSDSTNIYKKSYPITSTEITNYVEVATNILSVKALEEVLNIAETIAVPANGSVEITYSFNTVPVKNVQAPVVTCDAGISTDIESYAWGCVVTYTNSTAESKNVYTLSISGQSIESKNKSYVLAKDDVLIRDNGKIKTTIEHEFIQTSLYALSLANTLLDAYKQSLYDVSIQSRGDIGLYIGHKTQVLSDTEYMYITQRQNVSWNGALSVQYEGKKI